MLEALILLVITLVLIGSGLAIWRFFRGAARWWLGTAFRIVALSLLIVPLALFSTWKFSKARTVQLFDQIVPRVETSAPVVALTFDDGPTPLYTEEILSILDEHGVKATFFVTGREIEQNMAECRKIVAEGYELGNHSYSHAAMINKSLDFIRQEIERTDQLIRECGYEGDIHFRPPYSKKLILLPYYLGRTGRKSIFMDVEPESYAEISSDADRITAHVLEEARPGSIILLHAMYSSRTETMKAVPDIIRGLREEGYRFVTISELLALGTSSPGF